ncbi:GyrI-like domain-containing protein [Actomonas aquatica]|uniref:GyrI-like domain-containing protein n=1 Tax=Actomonas aquatica TaxID=2866162 RepID=A0ABZ1CC18_9BACT|nr:GyrI-like domain-containing protein [Opitutus sp. WL0086]WRQ88940.1 GyrI-like domain-containing protein [Opitutus sp. WL0086]
MPATDKIDLFKSLKTEYASPRQPRLINTSPGRYLSLTGSAVPGSEAYGAHVADLYAVAYTMKFRAKLHGGLDYAVGKLECIWLSLPDARDATTGWRWQLLMRVPDAIGEDDLATTIDALIDKKKPESVRDVQLVALHEGRCVQMLHVGPYDREPETFALMAEFAAAEGLSTAGGHHEIYLSDPRRVEPDRLKTILRLPVTS